MTSAYIHETNLYNAGYVLVGGMDEVGRGPLAGPVLVCAVILPEGLIIEGVYDSKKVSPKRRIILSQKIKEAAIAYGFGQVEADVIDQINILQATRLAMRQAVAALSPQPDALLIDGRFAPPLPDAVQPVCLTHGDTLSHSIAAASIVAKVTRDALMDKMHVLYPQYGFNTNKGYGTRQHIEAIHRYGLCPLHRKSFKLHKKPAVEHKRPEY